LRARRPAPLAPGPIRVTDLRKTAGFDVIDLKSLGRTGGGATASRRARGACLPGGVPCIALLD